MNPHIKLKLYATLQGFMPAEGEEYPISPGMTVQDILAQLNLPKEKAKLIFIDGTQAAPSSRLRAASGWGFSRRSEAVERRFEKPHHLYQECRTPGTLPNIGPLGRMEEPP